MTLDISRVLDNGHYQRVVAFAQGIGLYAPKCRSNWRDPRPPSYLAHALEYLDGYAENLDDGDRQFGKTQTRLYPDMSPASFSFYVDRLTPEGVYRPWFEGGLIYHGPTDGWGAGADVQTFAVTMRRK